MPRPDLVVSIKTPPEPPHQIRSSSAQCKPLNARRRSASRPNPSPDKNKTASMDESSLDNPDLGPFLLKLARNTIASGEGPNKALDYALRAAKSFERCVIEGEPSLDLAMSLHVVAAIYCSLGRFEEAIPVLERAIQEVSGGGGGADHALAAFSGYMQLGDTHSRVGHLERSIHFYKEGLNIQIQSLGDSDPRVAETCRYLAEAHVQAMQFDEAEKLCNTTLEICKLHNPPASLQEASDRRLMALICEAKGDYEVALEHLVLASMIMIANGKESEVASIDVSIGDIYLSLSRIDEAIFAYQKALTVFKSSKGDNHPSVASVFVRLADLYYKTGKLSESRSYCENALRVYAKPVPGTTNEEIASGMAEVSAIYESFEEPDEALKLLEKAMKLLEDKPGQQITIAGIEAMMGVMLSVVGRYEEAHRCLESAVEKVRGSGERRSALFGILLNQLGIACVQLLKIDEAMALFEEARDILEHVCGPFHQDTLGVYSNLAATYDAMGRVEDAIEILENVVKLRKEKLGTVNPEFENEKKRLADLLKEAGRYRNRKAKSLENLIGDPKYKRIKKQTSRKWFACGF